MGKKAFIASIIVSLILISLVAGMQAVEVAKANPFMYQSDGKVSPPSDAIPPTVTVSSLQNYTTYYVNEITLNFTVSVAIPTLPELFYYYLSLSEVYYKASWLSNNTYLDLQSYRNSIPPENRTFSNESYAAWGTYWQYEGYRVSPSFSVNLTEIPEGTNYLQIFASENGSRQTSKGYTQPPTIHYGEYELVGSAMVQFYINTPSPSPSLTLSPSPSPTPSLTETPSESPTQQPTPTQEPSSTPNVPQENLTSVAIIAGAVVAVVAVIGFLPYLAKYRGKK